MRRATLAAPTSRLEGVGIHTGKPSWVVVHPASGSEAEQGIRFRRASDGAVAAATPDHVHSSNRCTTISVGNGTLSTIEHLMSALHGLGISDAVVECAGVEAPILDGSAKPYVDALQTAGIMQMSGERDRYCPKTGMVTRGGDNSWIMAVPATEFSVMVVIDYPDRPDIGLQTAYYSGAGYADEIAPARTYGFLDEMDALLSAGLASGASLQNCVALTNTGAPDPRTPLRFGNELARHKLLDVIGDLALAGLDLQAHIVALRPNHAVNCTLARELRTRFAEMA